MTFSAFIICIKNGKVSKQLSCKALPHKGLFLFSLYFWLNWVFLLPPGFLWLQGGGASLGRGL